MDTLVIDLIRETLWHALLLAAPLVGTALVVGLLVGLLQALTQVQDQTISFVPKLLAVGAVLAALLPWWLGRLTQFAADLYSQASLGP